MLPQHAFQHQYHPGPDYHGHHAHAQAQAAAAAAAAAQQQHFGRIAAGSAAGMHMGGDHNSGGASESRGNNMAAHSANGQGQGSDNGAVSDENRRVLEWIAQMMRPETRESALLELSKKREQVPELALILWYSFGMFYSLV